MAIAIRPGKRSTAGGIDLSARVDPKDLQAILSELSHMPDEMKKAEYSAVRKTTKTGKTRISKMMRDQMGPGVLNKKLVDARLSTKFPSKAYPVGTIGINNRGYPLIHYKGLPKNPPRQEGISAMRRRGRKKPSWSVHKSQGKTTGRNHFVQRDRRGEVHIMVRSPGARGGKQAEAPQDYRIKYGPGLVDIAREFKFENKMIVDLGDVLEKNLKSQVDRFLQRRKRR